LFGTALIHALMVTDKRGGFKAWSVLLAIGAFSLSLLGTFLVRSGVLSSVHAFATDPRRGLFILAFLTVVIGASFSLYAWRAPTVGLGKRFSVWSKESALLGNNVLLLVAACSVLLGTLYPLLLDALGMGKISVGPPYFDSVFMPLMAPTIFLMGVGPLARWREADLPTLARRLRWAAAISVIASLLTGWSAGEIRIVSTLGLLMAYWIVASVATDVWERVRCDQPTWAKVSLKFNQIPRALVGMMVAHLGVAAFCFGVAMVKTYEVERDVKMNVGDTTTVRGYTFVFNGIKTLQGPNYLATQGQIEVKEAGGSRWMFPEKRSYQVQQNSMTEAAIDVGLSRDLYVSLGEQVEDGVWIVRVYVKPFIDWIWGGCLLMALGGVLAVTDRRYRRKQGVAV
jgi:cytochrome c-type biogenesis protein CcmF